MAEPKHTPGPWYWLLQHGEASLLSQASPRRYAVIASHTQHGIAVRDGQNLLVRLNPNHPDARLLAAAPDLLAMLERAEKYIGNVSEGEAPILAEIGDVIRRATGEAP